MQVALNGRAEPGASVSVCRDDQTIDDMWHEYRRTGSRRLRNQLVDHYMQTHVCRLADRLKSTLPSQVDVEDLKQQGYLGLEAAIDRFDLSRDVRFETFSGPRIYGAMRDYLRAIDPAPRLTRLRARRLEALMEATSKQRGQTPSDEELQQLLDLPVAKLMRVLSEARPAAMVSFNGARSDMDGDDDGDAMGSFEDRDHDSPLTEAERSDLRRWLTRGLTRRDYLIIVLYYYEHLTMREIGQALGISESRVSQRLESILQCLRARLDRTHDLIEFYF